MTEDKIRALVESQHQAFTRSVEERRKRKLEAFLDIARYLKGGKKSTKQIGDATGIKGKYIYYYLNTLCHNDILDKESDGRQLLWMLKE